MEAVADSDLLTSLDFDATTRVLAGTVALDRNKTDVWPLDKGNGPRKITHYVSFKSRFRDKPLVSVSLKGFDMEKDTHGCIAVAAQNVTDEGFNLIISTWGESHIYGAQAAWIAFG